MLGCPTDPMVRISLMRATAYAEADTVRTPAGAQDEHDGTCRIALYKGPRESGDDSPRI